MVFLFLIVYSKPIRPNLRLGAGRFGQLSAGLSFSCLLDPSDSLQLLVWMLKYPVWPTICRYQELTGCWTSKRRETDDKKESTKFMGKEPRAVLGNKPTSWPPGALLGLGKG